MKKMKTYIVQFEISCILNNQAGGVACQQSRNEGGQWPMGV